MNSDKSLEKGICWGTFNYKLNQDICVRGFMPSGADERRCFFKIHNKKLHRDFIILEHIRNDFIIAKGSFLGRVVAMGKDHNSVIDGLTQGRKLLASTINEVNIRDN